MSDMVGLTLYDERYRIVTSRVLGRGAFGTVHAARVYPRYVLQVIPDLLRSRFSADTLLNVHGLVCAYAVLPNGDWFYIQKGEELQHLGNKILDKLNGNPHVIDCKNLPEAITQLPSHGYRAAVKFLKYPDGLDQGSKDFEREKAALKRMGEYLFSIMIDETLCLVMNRVDGGSLHNKMPSLSSAQEWRLAVNVPRRLAYIQEIGFVHLDVSPANLLLGPTGNVKLVDYGMARPRPDGASRCSDLSHVCGDYAGGSSKRNFYTAPEISRIKCFLHRDGDLPPEKELQEVLKFYGELLILQGERLLFYRLGDEPKVLQFKATITGEQRNSFLKALLELAKGPQLHRLPTSYLRALRSLTDFDWMPKYHPRSDVFNWAVSLFSRLPTVAFLFTSHTLPIDEQIRLFNETCKVAFGLQFLEHPLLGDAEIRELTILAIRCLALDPAARLSMRELLAIMQRMFPEDHHLLSLPAPERHPTPMPARRVAAKRSAPVQAPAPPPARQRTSALPIPAPC